MDDGSSSIDLIYFLSGYFIVFLLTALYSLIRAKKIKSKGRFNEKYPT